MASAQACEDALHALATRLGPGSGKSSSLERSLECTVSDLGIRFTGRLDGGQLRDVARGDAADAATAQIRITVSSDDLVALTTGELGFGSAFASGRVKIDATVMDLLRLRSLL